MILTKYPLTSRATLIKNEIPIYFRNDRYVECDCVRVCLGADSIFNSMLTVKLPTRPA